MNNRFLSSKLTIVFKFVFPSAFVAGTGMSLGSWFGILPRSGTDSQSLAAFIVGSVLTLRWLADLKRVRLKGDTLYISNYINEIAIPIRMISQVTENPWVNIHPVTIHFRQTTEFGEKISFMPEARIFSLFSSHPVVEELRKMANGKQQNGIGA